ncbi:pimeloyl-ACP methyl ester carboxylesterase [Kribbella antiqua]|uniref:Pimeloyl-ACP methyl ester carboxylesterase n=1 Tax=Kribbella antiqua TaxID=2512217 RepID=A0A4R2IA96_9ACTN|nr:epoxide hydrolase family protein [Kribbella antiqua]TCO40589.1 pimeloyl-ACP methyl ester carboxylesterase [Kribbella antiqua]
MTIEPFRLEIPEADLTDLWARLDLVRWPDELPGVGWAYGVSLAYLQELVHYWRTEYDWRKAEARLNEWPQHTTTIDGAGVHFAHLRSPEPEAMPLILTHGWPGSIVEFTDVAGPLTDPRAYGGDPADAFHLVLPSIPGFPLSGPTREPGWEFMRTARAWGVLMERLGYDRYGVQGGDWGAAISRELGRIQPERVIGVHLNLIPGAGATSEPTPEELEPLTPAERERTWASWRRQQGWLKEKQGYADLQSTKPQTLAYALTDSPVGQLAWIAEKFHDWSDPSSDLDRDHLLTNVMLYWFTRTAGSAGRIYYERAHAPYWGQPPEPSTTPTALLDLAHDNFIPLRHRVAHTDNIVRWTSHPNGGHFAALEQPEVLVTDVREFFRGLQ